jgi:hypothetical protein
MSVAFVVNGVVRIAKITMDQPDGYNPVDLECDVNCANCQSQNLKASNPDWQSVS